MERLSGLDASFLYLETPQVPLHVSMVAVLDPEGMPPGDPFEVVRQLILERLPLLPPFRRRLMRVPFDLHHPLWVDDPDFDIDRHVHSTRVRPPGGTRELADVVGHLASLPLDRSLPLWDAWVIEGLQHGHLALLTKVHHSAIDGATGADLLVNLFDLERKARPRPAEGKPPAAPLPTQRELVRHALASRLKGQLDLLKLAERTVRGVGEVVRERKRGASAGGTPLTAPRSLFNGTVGAGRKVALARVSLDGVKRVKNAQGTTVNDVVLAICAGALRRYLTAHNALPAAPLVAVCPISVRGEGMTAHGANKVSAMFTSLATDIDDPVQRLHAIRETTRAAKTEHNALGATTLQNWAEYAAPTTFNLAARFYTRLRLADRHRPIYNVLVSNVPGPQFPIYLAGAQLVAAYPLGPVMEGMGLNITVMSYRGALDFGFMASRDLVPDVQLVADALGPATDELLAACEGAGAARDRDTAPDRQ